MQAYRKEPTSNPDAYCCGIDRETGVCAKWQKQVVETVELPENRNQLPFDARKKINVLRLVT